MSLVSSLIVTIPLSLEISVEIFKGSHGKYYSIKHIGKKEDLFPIYYDIHFPINWLFSEEFKQYPSSPSSRCNNDCLTGPKHCTNCKKYGFYNGVFIGYCLNCASEFYNSRGNGLTDIEGIELNENMVAFDLTYFQKEKSIWKTYLKGISLEQIGDVHLKEEYELYKDLPDLIPDKVDDEDDELKNLDWNLSEKDSDYYFSDSDSDDWKQNQIDKLIDRF